MRTVVVGDRGLPAWVAAHNALQPAATRQISEETLQEWRERSTGMVWFAVRDDEETVAVGLGATGGSVDDGIADIRICVAPTHRRRGAGTSLLAVLVAWARELECTGLTTFVDSADGMSLAWAQHHGFEVTGRDDDLALDLWAQPAPEADVPEGIEIVSLAQRPDLAHDVYEVYEAVVADVRGITSQTWSYAQWWGLETAHLATSPHEMLHVALRGAEVVGVARLRRSRTERDALWHGITGVRPERRERGIGSALTRHQIRWATDHVFRTLRLRLIPSNAVVASIAAEYGYVPAGGRFTLHAPMPTDDTVAPLPADLRSADEHSPQT